MRLNKLNELSVSHSTPSPHEKQEHLSHIHEFTQLYYLILLGHSSIHPYLGFNPTSSPPVICKALCTGLLLLMPPQFCRACHSALPLRTHILVKAPRCRNCIHCEVMTANPHERTSPPPSQFSSASVMGGFLLVRRFI